MVFSSDEGEIIEGDGHEAQDLKAHPLPSTTVKRSSHIDRQDRPRDNRYQSPDLDTSSQHSNSSRRSGSPRGFKRSRDGRDYRYDDRRRDDRPRYRDREGYGRRRVAYDDLDRPSASEQYSRQDRDRDHDRNGYDHGRRQDRRHDRHRDGYADKRPRRSQSPSARRNVGPMHFVRGGEDRQNAPNFRGGHRAKGFAQDSVRDASRQANDTKTANTAPSAAPEPPKPSVPPVRQLEISINSDSEPVAIDDTNYDEAEVLDEEAEIERRRKRREELLAKSSSATPLLLQAVGAGEKARAASPAVNTPTTPAPASPMETNTPHSGKSLASTGRASTDCTALTSPRSPASNDEPSPGIDLLNDHNLINAHGITKADEDDGPSAADYDPTADMKEDERRDELRHGQVVLHGEPHIVQTTEQTEDPSPDKVAEDDDGDDDFDMFADDFDENKYATKPTAAPLEADDGEGPNDKGGILEAVDKDGYYKIRVGEVLNGRYQIQTALGKGMFSGVARALDLSSKQLVAIKIMRNNDALRKGGFTEIAILEKLNEADKDNRRHIVTFLRSFDYKGHLCMVFENLSMNLREVLKKFGNNVGINLMATRAYAYQIFVALAHMRKCSIIHADLKPDNILVNETRNVLKICDLGTAIDRSDAATAHTEITPYLVSRFYRAPEIILGMPYDYGVDMWSIGCTLYELYTGKILFTGDSNNQMLKAIMEVRGRLTPKLFKRGQLSGAHFDEGGQFVSIERDKVLGKTAVRKLAMVKPTRDLRTRLTAASSRMNDQEMRELNHFVDLLEACLALNPDKRMKPADALKHPFFAAKLGATAVRR